MKTLLLKKQDPSFWVSCQSITQNLTLAYRYRLNDELSVWDYDEKQSSYEVMLLARKIKDSSFDRVVWIDHHPHPQKLLRALDKEFQQSSSRPELNFHLFGDFSLMAPQWEGCSEVLKKFFVRFICASTNQARFVKSFLKEGEDVFVFPFPVDESSFYFSKEERRSWRDQHNVDDNTKVILYTGRLSVQKNVIEMIRVFSRVKKFLEQGEDDIRLFIAGPMDDLGLPFIGKRGLPGSFFRLWHKEWLQQQELVKKEQLIYLGEQGLAELRAAYCGADLFCSFSTHNDEDYGMSIAEASCTGLPLVLSQWGGFPDFVNLQQREEMASCLIPVQLDSGPRPLPQWRVAQKKMFSILNQVPLGPKKRDAAALAAQKEMGIVALSDRLEQLYRGIPSRFKGFNEMFIKFSRAFEARPQAPFTNIKGQYNDLFKECYRPYIEPGDIE